MDSVLDFLFLRRLKFNYISPPVCPFPIASASSRQFGQFIPPLVQMPPMGINNGFLIWGSGPNQICYNIYEEISAGNFINVAACVPPNTLIVCSAACWKVSAVVGSVEGPLSSPVCTDGTSLVEISLPFATGITSYKIYKSVDGGLTYSVVLSGIFTGAFEVCNFTCYSISAVTPDGETPISEVTCPPKPGPCDEGIAFATAWADRVVVNGGPRPSGASQTVVAVLKCGLITAGIDSKMISWNLFVPDSLIAAASPQQPGDDLQTFWNLQNFVPGDLTLAGLKGDAATKFINPGQTINTTSRSAQSIGISVYTSVASISANERAAGGIQSTFSTPGIVLGTHDNTPNSTALNGANPGNIISTLSPGAGFYSDQRVSNVDHRLYYGSSLSPLAQLGATDAVPYNGIFSDSDPFFFCINQGGSVLLLSSETLSAAIITTGLTSSEVTALFTLFQTARQSLGGGYV